jgi:hypothetical protein
LEYQHGRIGGSLSCHDSEREEDDYNHDDGHATIGVDRMSTEEFTIPTPWTLVWGESIKV